MKITISLEVQQLRTTFVVMVLVLCVSSEAFKFPNVLRKSMNEASQQHEKTQLQVEDEQNSGVSKRNLLFPEKADDSYNVEYEVRLSMGTQDENKDTQQLFQGDNVDLKRFYKYTLKTLPKADQVIVFREDDDGSTNSKRITEVVEKSSDDIPVGSRSEGKLLGNTEPGIAYGKLQANTTANYIQSLETLAQMVRQILFHLPVTDTPHHIITTEPTLQTYDASSELDVQEQSLYSGPKLRSSSSSKECPEGTKRTRNGSCQKPSRRIS